MISSSPLIKCEIGAITTSDNAFKSSCDDVDSFSSVLALSGKPFFSSSKGSSEKCSSHLKPLTPICFCMFSSSSWSRSDCVFFAQTDTAVPSVVPRNSTSRSVPPEISLMMNYGLKYETFFLFGLPKMTGPISLHSLIP